MPPFPLERGDSFILTIQYLPSTSETTTGEITFTYTDGALTPTFVVNLRGTAPEFAYTYTPQGGNTTQVVPGAALAFPDTATGNTATATVTLTNRGTATGPVNSIATTGSAFQVTGLPLLPTEVDAGGQMSFTVSFTPEQLNEVCLSG